MPKPASEEEARQRQRHHWIFQAGTWRCSVCRDWINARSVPAYRQHQACRGRAIEDDAARIAAEGHTLCRAAAQLPFIICTSCGAWGNRRTRKLARRCGPPTAAGRQAVKRANGGWHPLLRKDARGQDLPRDRAHITHAFDPLRGAWISVTATGDDGAPAEPGDIARADPPAALISHDVMDCDLADASGEPPFPPCGPTDMPPA